MSRDGDQLLLPPGNRDTPEQSFRVWVKRILEEILHRRFLHDLSGIHDRYRVTELGHHTHVVGNQDDRHIVFLPQLPEQIQDLSLDGHIQSCGRFVRDENLRFAHQRGGDHRPLAHPAGKLEGIVLRTFIRRGNPYPDELAHGRLKCFFFRFLPMDLQSLAYLAADLCHRVKGGHRILEDHGGLVAPQLLLFFLCLF